MPRTEEFPMLVAQEGPLKGQRWPVNRPMVLGREATCDVVISDRQVSRFHARLTPTPEGIILEDLGSKNGTHHNGNPLSAPVMLQDGDAVQISFVQEFLFFTSDATVPLAEGLGRPGRLALAQQLKLLWLLYENQGQVISRSDLVSAVWGEEQAAGVSDQALDALIRRLRDRLSTLDPDQSYIDTVRGHGVRLDNPSA